jgi:hypothetical protein
MSRNAFTLGFSMILGLCVSRSESQQSTPLPTCPTEQARAFDFLVGRFRGVVYDLSGTDSALTRGTRHLRRNPPGFRLRRIRSNRLVAKSPCTPTRGAANANLNVSLRNMLRLTEDEASMG